MEIFWWKYKNKMQEISRVYESTSVNMTRWSNKNLSYRRGTARCVVSVWNLANCHTTVQKLLVRQVLNQVSAVTNWPVRQNRAVDSSWRSVR